MSGLPECSDAIGRFSAEFEDAARELAYRRQNFVRDRGRLLTIVLIATALASLNLVIEIHDRWPRLGLLDPVLAARAAAIFIGAAIYLWVLRSASLRGLTIVSIVYGTWIILFTTWVITVHPQYHTSGQVTSLGVMVFIYLFAPIPFRTAVAMGVSGAVLTGMAWAFWRASPPTFSEIYRFALWAVTLHIFALLSCYERERTRRVVFVEAINLQESVRREQDAMGRQRQFTSMIAHELRNPLAIIRAQAQVAVEEVVTKAQVSPARYVAIERAIVRIERLFNQWLQIDKLEDTQFMPTFTQMSFSAWFCEFQSQLGSEGRVSFTKSDVADCQLMADASLLNVVLGNLVDNALKYSPGGEPVSVDVRREKNELIISVQDHGVGIAKDDTARIFEKYSRGKNTKGTSGFGLGLFLVRHILQLHGGRVDVYSELGKGSRFSMILPA